MDHTDSPRSMEERPLNGFPQSHLPLRTPFPSTLELLFSLVLGKTHQCSRSRCDLESSHRRKILETHASQHRLYQSEAGSLMGHLLEFDSR